jgi:hypothetical protein
MQKKCAKCDQLKSMDSFTNNKSKKDGKCPYCRDCYAVINKTWRKNNPARDKIIHDKWRQNNVNKVRKARLKGYYRSHEKNKMRNKLWKQNNKDKVNEINKRYQNNKYKTDINYKIKVTLRNRFYKLIKGKHKKNSVLKLLGCSIDELKIYLEKKFIDGMSWTNHGKWHIDHIKPCCSFDLTKISEQKKCFHYTNLQPLWAKDNIIKNAKFIEPDDLPDHTF